MKFADQQRENEVSQKHFKRSSSKSPWDIIEYLEVFLFIFIWCEKFCYKG